MDELIVIGGGVIGLSIAYEAAKRDRQVTVLERSDFGREASWAGAGILPPGAPGADEAMAAFCRESARIWPDLAAELREVTGIDNGFRRCGGVVVTSAEEMPHELSAWQAAGVDAQQFDAAKLAERVGPIDPIWAEGAVHLPELAQVRNPRHLKALVAACVRRGVTLRSGEPVCGIDHRNGAVSAVRTPTGRYEGTQVVVAGGAWSRQILGDCGLDVDIEPIRGQIVLLSTSAQQLKCVLELGPRYVVPRPDGRILIGSTEERVGFSKGNTAEGIRSLIDFGVSLVPDLAAAQFERAWSGLRPYSSRGRPYIGPVPRIENLYVATGHFRAGLTLSPMTARVMVELLAGETPSIPLESFALECA